MKAIVLVFQGVVDDVAVVPDYIFDEVELMLKQTIYRKEGYTLG